MVHSYCTEIQKVVAPIVGGDIKETTWVGSSSIVGKKLERPKSMLAWRSDDFKGESRVEEACQQGLQEARKLELDDKSSSITLTSWIQCIKVYMEKRGLDTVFKILRVGRAHVTETYI